MEMTNINIRTEAEVKAQALFAELGLDAWAGHDDGYQYVPASGAS